MLSKGYPASQLASILETFVPLYIQIVQELQREGVQWVQIDEPSLVTDVSDSDMKLIASIYEQLKQAAPKLKIWVQTYFESVEHYEQLVAFPVDVIGLDFVHGQEANLSSLEAHGFSANKMLAVGLVDGRNIWSSDYDAKLKILERICQVVPHARLVLQPSCSLLHSPVSTEGESKLDPVLRQALSFANEKLDEVRDLTQAINEDYAAIEGQMKCNRTAILDLNQSSSRNVAAVQQAIKQLQAEKELHSSRNRVFAERRLVQDKKWQLPFLPTTTIGSFPQSAEVRQARLKFRKGDSSKVQYDAFVREQIKTWIELQEQIGLDVLVHGEFERTDMVEFFGEKLPGFAFTQNGWVQSYGSRCVKPPVIYGDIHFDEPMTVEETVYAQTLTSKPVKGMLTGPITILNWSFVRDDITREQVAFQIALALREEVEALERAGIEMIQVDEPALREGLPLRRDDWAAYLEWSVLAFRISTASVKDTTQIHTHMCYCEFHDIIDSIQALDADVISIETSRSHGELIHSFEDHTYTKGIGLGVYDIHSPRVPSVDEMVNMIERALKVLDPSLFWINPDCGLKTRGIAETVESLTQMVKATQKVRELRKVD
jgi:5-methyltetrahydropteroyltriglutamate--homocysteine methyltransferase